MAAGLYIDRKIIKTGKLEEMSEEELELKMKKILEDYAPLLGADVVEGESQEVVEAQTSSEVLSSSEHTKSETPIAPKK